MSKWQYDFPRKFEGYMKNHVWDPRTGKYNPTWTKINASCVNGWFRLRNFETGGWMTNCIRPSELEYMMRQGRVVRAEEMEGPSYNDDVDIGTLEDLM